MSIVRFNGDLAEFDRLNWDVGFQGFEQWLNKGSPLRPDVEKFTIINSVGTIIGTRWIIYNGLEISDVRFV